jgi:hypothetical protein
MEKFLARREEGSGRARRLTRTIGTEFVTDCEHACAAERHQLTIMSQRSGSEPL